MNGKQGARGNCLASGLAALISACRRGLWGGAIRIRGDRWARSDRHWYWNSQII